MAQSAAAYAVARRELAQRSIDLAAAVTDTVPYRASGKAALLSRINRREHAEALAGYVALIGRDLCAAAAVGDGAALEAAGIEQYLAAAVAAAAPDGVSVFAPRRPFSREPAGRIHTKTGGR